jgi:SnoaL-like domain
MENPLVALDVLAIQQLLARYCVYLDQRDFDTWSHIWAPDAELHVFGQVWTGPEITEHISQSDHGLHMAGIPQILVNGDGATGLQNFIFVEADGHGLRIGYYDDEFVRLKEGWHFASRKIKFIKPPKT